MSTVSSKLNVNDVVHHLHNMYGVFNDIKDLGAVELYIYILLSTGEGLCF